MQRREVKRNQGVQFSSAETELGVCAGRGEKGDLKEHYMLRSWVFLVYRE